MKKVFTLIAALVFAVAAMAETINVESHKITKYQGTDEGGNWVQYIFDSEIGKFYFCFYAEGEAEDIVAGTTYALADMDAEYCAYVVSNSEYYDYTTASFTKQDEKNFTATVTCTDGNTYNLTVAPLQPITEPIDTVLLNVTNPNSRLYDIVTSSKAFQLYGQDNNNEYYLYFAIQNATQIGGTYTSDNVYADYTTLYHMVGADTTSIEFSNLLPDAVVNQVDGVTSATINYVGIDSVLYIITYAYADPTAKNTVNIVANNLTIQQNAQYSAYEMYYGVYAYDVMASDANYIVYVTTFNAENDYAYGSYDYADGYVNIGVYGTDYEEVGELFDGGVITVAKNGTATSLTGDALYYGDTKYTFNCTGDASAVENVEASDYEVYNEGRVIVLNGAEGQNAAIYDIAGRMISNTTVNSDNARFEVAAAGVYVVRVNGESFRVVVK